MNAGWKHLIVTYDGTTLLFYLDGVLKTSLAYSGHMINNHKIGIGGYYNTVDIVGYTDFLFKGALDEIRIYNRALNSSEVTQLYNFQKPGGCTDVTPPTSVTVSASPSSGTAGTTSIALSGTASDNSGTIAKMQWFNGATQIGVDDVTSPFGISYVFPTAGTFNITSKAFDACGNNTSSPTPVIVTITGGGGSSQWTTSGTGIFYASDVHVGKGNTNKGPETGYSLYVGNGIKTEKIKVELPATGGWADYIFNNDFHLLPIKQVERFIKSNQHLPGFPSEKTILNDGGYEISDMMKRQQVGIESLYLYIIELEKKVEKMKVLEKRLEELERKINK